MQDLYRFLGSPQSPWVLLIVFGAIVFIVHAVSRGFFAVHTDKVTIGRDVADREAVIRERQCEYISMAVNGTMRAIPKHDAFDEWRTRFVLEKVINLMTHWTIVNHIDATDRYINLKVEEVWGVIQKYTWHELYQSEEFKHYVAKFVRDVITNLVAYRKEYSR